MRRVIGLALVGLGAFLFVAALLLRVYVAGQVVKFPLNEYVKTTLVARNVSYFSTKLLRPVTGARIVITDTIKGDAKLGSSSTAVWNEFTYLYDTTNHVRYAISVRRAAFDRRTSQLVDCCGANIGGKTSIPQTGLSGYVWPIGTAKQTYQVFDTTLNRPMPYRYAGTSTIDGISVYRFVETVPPTKFGPNREVPGSLVGSSQKQVTLYQYYAGTNTSWVDPQTGGVLNTTQNQKLTLDDATGAQRVLLFDGDIVMTPQSEHQAVSLDSSGRNELHWFTTLIPLIVGLAGALALIAGIVLHWLRPREQPEDSRTEEPEPALGPAL